MTPAAPTTPQNQAPDTLRSDARTIGLIGLAHGSSHFFHLLLPPLFPWLIKDFNYTYSELSVLVSLFFIVSGTGQALAGFAVDRFGARPILFAALGSFAVAGLIASTAQGYSMLLAASFFAGLGNAPFHPVDFTILNKRVSPCALATAFPSMVCQAILAGRWRRCSWRASPRQRVRGARPAFAVPCGR